MSAQLPVLPGTNLDDPNVLAGAQRVATRRNNDARRKLAKERAALPLFAAEIPTDPAHLVTVEEVIERRAIAQAAAWDNGSERDIRTVEEITRLRNQVWTLVPEAEYLELYDRSFDWGFPLSAYWYLALDGIKRRAEPMTEIGAWLLTLLAEWEGVAPTAPELHQRCGDGRAYREILDGLRWLEDRRYARGGVLRPCRYSSTGSSAPWTITEPGLRYLAEEAPSGPMAPAS